MSKIAVRFFSVCLLHNENHQMSANQVILSLKIFAKNRLLTYNIFPKWTLLTFWPRK